VTSVLIIDDHPIVLQGCRRILEDAHVDTVLEARDAVSGIGATAHKPDVVVIDLAMQGRASVARADPPIKSQNARARSWCQHAQRSTNRGARAESRRPATSSKDTSSEEFVEALKRSAPAHRI